MTFEKNPSQRGPVRHVLWGSVLSPFFVKIRAMFDHAGRPYRSLPAESGLVETTRTNLQITIAKLRRTVETFPPASALDEYPIVPFVIEDGTRVLYDSSGIGRWLDATRAPGSPALVPEDPEVRWMARLIDEAFDEFGLYMLHHNRWVVSARDDDASLRIATEFGSLVLPGTKRFCAWMFARRQVRRLPYLFSVAPEGFALAGLARTRTPPSRKGFPATHALLEEAWFAYLDAIETILADRPYLLGERFTIADASAFGQLGCSFVDPTAHRRLRERAPRTHAWLEAIWRGDQRGREGAVALDDGIAPLARIIGQTFVPLMQQNEAAYERARRDGVTVFNEVAFDRGLALYDGTLLGHPFRSVAKTFQVRVWRDLAAEFRALDATQRARIERTLGCTVLRDG